MRVQKYIANNRRQVEGLIQAKEITVNGAAVSLGCTVKEGDSIAYQEKVWQVSLAEKKEEALLLYHKPVGEIVTQKDAQNRPTVFQSLPRAPTGKWIAVGRLDINTQGLLVFVNAGDLANELMHPRANLIRRYKVRVFGEVSEQVLTRLTKGVDIDGASCRFQEVSRIVEKDRLNNWFAVGVTSGRYRMVRKMWESVGCKVSKLVRVQFGPIHLPGNLKQGQHHIISPKELEAIKKQLKKNG